MYALITNGVVSTYPYSVGMYRTDNPNISVPITPTESQLQELGIFEVHPSTRPADSMGTVVEEVTPTLVNGVWTQQWEVRDADPVELNEQQRVLTNSIVAATQQRLDTFAKTRGYDDVNSISKYKDISDEEIAAMPEAEQPLVTKFRAESRYLASMTARTWASLYLVLGAVENRSRPMPNNFDDIVGDLPALVWPDSLTQFI